MEVVLMRSIAARVRRRRVHHRALDRARPGQAARRRQASATAGQPRGRGLQVGALVGLEVYRWKEETLHLQLHPSSFVTLGAFSLLCIRSFK